ncbi:MAG: hypothetical protein SNJ77_11970, partial [Cytophagales bacterium]
DLGLKYGNKPIYSTKKSDFYFDLIIPLLRKGYGVSIGFAGHIMRVQSLNAEGMLLDDPFGKMDINKRVANGGSGGWIESNSSDGIKIVGDNVLYKWTDIEKTSVTMVEWFYK